MSFHILMDGYELTKKSLVIKLVEDRIETTPNHLKNKRFHKNMDLLSGMLYNIRGFCFGIKSGKLLFWGTVRFLLIILIMLLLSGLIITYHQEIMKLIWEKPQNQWIVWLWHFLSILIFLFLMGLASIISYIMSQILFSAFIMDYMSRITEYKITGHIKEPTTISFGKRLVYLMKQEIPRAIIPVSLSVILFILGWFTVFGPIMVFFTSGIAIIFLAWDNTDLVPARRFIPFKARFLFLVKTLLFHIGFGIPFLIPGLNIFFLVFAPVGATLYHLDKHDEKSDQ